METGEGLWVQAAKIKTHSCEHQRGKCAMRHLRPPPKTFSNCSLIERELQVFLPLFVEHANTIHCTGAIVAGVTSPLHSLTWPNHPRPKMGGLKANHMKA